jgi:hypothetical protein
VEYAAILFLSFEIESHNKFAPNIAALSVHHSMQPLKPSFTSRITFALSQTPVQHSIQYRAVPPLLEGYSTAQNKQEQNIMPYYGIHDAKVESMICTTCQSDIFAWMAEIFACSTCGGTEYAFSEESSSPGVQEYSSCASERGAEMQDSVRKRKRSTSGERHRKQSR